jgi:GDP-4-dehydro-6-deoxy-D-mannose reductase
MRLLITGASGFIGRHLCRLAADQGHEIIGTYLAREELALTTSLGPEIRWEPLDLQEPSRVGALIDEVRPEGVFHLAGQAYAARAWEDPITTFRTNVEGTVRLYEALRRHPPREGTFVASSASAYGAVVHLPTNEETPLNPINPYGVSKACQDMLSFQYAQNFGLRIVRGRLFITTGPGKTGDALNDFAQRIVAVEATGNAGTLRVGNLGTRRDISDVRDVTRAIWKVFEQGRPEQAVNIGAGRSVSMASLVESLLRLARVPLTLAPDPALFRATDEPEIRADISRLRALGFASEFPLERTIRDALEYWRHPPPGHAPPPAPAGPSVS